jgi:hypothetical protein
MEPALNHQTVADQIYSLLTQYLRRKSQTDTRYTYTGVQTIRAIVTQLILAYYQLQQTISK